MSYHIIRTLLAAVPTTDLEYIEYLDEDVLSGQHVDAIGVNALCDGGLSILWKDEDFDAQDIAYYRLFAAAPRTLQRLLDEVERLRAERDGAMAMASQQQDRGNQAEKDREQAVSEAARLQDRLNEALSECDRLQHLLDKRGKL
jgi:hypothetical protein